MKNFSHLFSFLLFPLIILAPSAALSVCPDLSESQARTQIEILSSEIREHDRLYYLEGAPSISDRQYDQLKERLRELEVCFPGVTTVDSPLGDVGYPPEEGDGRIRHPQPMLSLSSSTDAKAVRTLLQRLKALGASSGFLLQPKVDGLPVELTYVQGRLQSAATRGDGVFGRDVLSVVQKIEGIPHHLSGSVPSTVVVRGEIYVDRFSFARHSHAEYASPRHLAVASLQSANPDSKAIDLLRFYPFEWLSADLSLCENSDSRSLEFLSRWGFQEAGRNSHRVSTQAEIEVLYRDYLKMRGEQRFAMDGIVVKVDDLALRQKLGNGPRAPLWAAAWKFPPETALSTVVEIDCRVGRTGRVTPVAEIEPVQIAGVQVRRVNLHSNEEMSHLGVGIGSEVLVALQGDVIPQLVGVLSPGKDGGFACGQEEGGLDACLTDSPGCREQFLARAVHFCSKKGLSIKGLGPGRLRCLIEAGCVESLPDLLKLRAEQITSVDGFGVRSAGALAAAIRQSKQASFSQKLSALGIPGVGINAAAALAKKFRDFPALQQATVQQLESVPGIGAKTAQQIYNFIRSAQGTVLVEYFIATQSSE